MYENILDSGHHIFSKSKYIFRGDICDMRRLWGLVGGLAKPLRLALLLLLSGQPLTGLLIRIRKVVMMGIMILKMVMMVTLNRFEQHWKTFYFSFRDRTLFRFALHDMISIY